MQMHLPGH